MGDDRFEQYKDHLLGIAIFSTVSTVIFTPIYAYGILQWKKYKNHIMIQKRFPALTVSLILISYLANISSMIARWIQHIHENTNIFLTFAVALICIGYYLIILRLILVYLRFKKSKKTLLSKRNIKSESHEINFSVENTADKFKQKSLYYHWSSILILTYTIITSAIIAFGDHSQSYWPLILITTLTIFFILAISLTIFIACLKVKDGLGITKETLLLIIIAIISFFVSGSENMSDNMIVFAVFVSSIHGFVMGLVPLFGPLFRISRFEKSSKNQELKSNADTVVEEVIPLHAFLNEHENYKLFNKYLTHCWALENMLFLERVSVMFHIVLKYKKLCNDNSECELNSCGHIIYKLKFDYLEWIYEEYNKVINKELETNNVDNTKAMNDVTFECVKSGFNKIYYKIFKEFVETGSLNEINIPFQKRQRLAFLLDKFAGPNMKKLSSFNDYLKVFEDAFSEIYKLVMLMYGFEFKKYSKLNNNV